MLNRASFSSLMSKGGSKMYGKKKPKKKLKKKPILKKKPRRKGY
tara:strand:+ start:426 stop:557 length:132 start_codon:yes stop_codon:yes gene_type:complete